MLQNQLFQLLMNLVRKESEEEEVIKKLLAYVKM